MALRWAGGLATWNHIKPECRVKEKPEVTVWKLEELAPGIWIYRRDSEQEGR